MTDNKYNKAKKQGQVITITSKKILVNELDCENIKLDFKNILENQPKNKPIEKQQQIDKNGGCAKNQNLRLNSQVFKQSRVSLPIANDVQSKLLPIEDHLKQQSNNISKLNKQFELKIGTAHSRNDANGIIKYLSNPTSGTTRNHHCEQNSAIIKPIQTTSASHLSSQSTSLSQSAFIGMRKTSYQQKFQKNHIKQMVIKIQQAEGQANTDSVEMIKKNQATKALANPPFSVKNVVLSQMKSNYGSGVTRAPKIELNSVDRLDDTIKKALGSEPKRAPIEIVQGSDFKPLSSQQIDQQLVQMTPSHSNHSKHFRFSTETSTQVEKSFHMIKPYSNQHSSKRDSSNNFINGTRIDPTQSPLSQNTTGNKFLQTRPISNLGAHHAGLFHMARTSLPNILTSHISPITMQQEPKRLTPSEPPSDLEHDNDDDTL